MFKAMRRIERRMDDDKRNLVLNNGLYGVLSINSNDEYAYGVPLCYVYDGENIYFHMAEEGHKLELLKSDGNVSFCVIGNVNNIPEQFSMSYESVIVFGIAEKIGGDEKQQALEMLIKKYANQRMAQGLEYIKSAAHKTVVVALRVRHMTGKERPSV